MRKIHSVVTKVAEQQKKLKTHFSFEVFPVNKVANTIENLLTGKTSVPTDIPVYIVKEIIDVYLQYLFF